MKTLKLLFIAAVFGATFFVSCTPENINDDQNPQQIGIHEFTRPING